MSVNHFHGIGRLTRDPVLKQTKSGHELASFGLAINERTKNSEEQKALFLEIECWNQMAEVVAKNLHKGRLVYVQGRLKQDTWESQGVKHSKITIVANSIEFLDKPSNSDSQEPE